jgi:hypothetical protein
MRAVLGRPRGLSGRRLSRASVVRVFQGPKGRQSNWLDPGGSSCKRLYYQEFPAKIPRQQLG